jgi:hypothetical protein
MKSNVYFKLSLFTASGKVFTIVEHKSSFREDEIPDFLEKSGI